MKYLFFDIECANRDADGRNQIYSFGYLLTDENLNVIETEKDIVINPNVEQWDWYVVKHMLAYPKRYVESQPTFDHYYNKIKRLLENRDTMVCGFSVKDDVGYLLDECERYNLEPFQFEFFDIQRLDMEQSKERRKKKLNLSETYMSWCGRIPLSIHRSDVDARLTYEIAREICKRTKKAIADYKTESSILMGNIDGFRYGFNDEELMSRAERNVAQGIQNKGGRKNRMRPLKEGQEDFILKGSKNYIMFLRHLDFVSPKSDCRQNLKDQKVSISINFEMHNFKQMMLIIQRICDHGGEYVRKASTATIFVKEPNNKSLEERDCTKFNYVQEQISNGVQIEIIEFDELMNRLDITNEDLAMAQDVDYEYLLDDKYSK